MALAGALCCVINTVTGFTNRSLRGLVAGLLGADYTANQMSYDPRRLRLHGLIEKIPSTNTYRTTPEGIRAAVFYTKVRDRLLGPLLDTGDQPPAPVELRTRPHTDRPDPHRLHRARATRHSRMKTRHKIRGLRPQEIYDGLLAHRVADPDRTPTAAREMLTPVAHGQHTTDEVGPESHQHTLQTSTDGHPAAPNTRAELRLDEQLVPSRSNQAPRALPMSSSPTALGDREGAPVRSGRGTRAEYPGWWSSGRVTYPAI